VAFEPAVDNRRGDEQGKCEDEVRCQGHHRVGLCACMRAAQVDRLDRCPAGGGWG
jgi:hypothetical protein